MTERWLLVVTGATKGADLMMHRLGMRPSKFNASEYYGHYALSAKPLMLDHIERLKAVGLHGAAKKIAVKKRKPRTIAKKSPVTAPPSAEIVALIHAKKTRLDADHKRAAHARKKREADAAAEIRARQAILQAKGEL